MGVGSGSWRRGGRDDWSLIFDCFPLYANDLCGLAITFALQASNNSKVGLVAEVVAFGLGHSKKIRNACR